MPDLTPEAMQQAARAQIARPSQLGSYAHGGNLNKFVKTADAPATDLKTLLKVDSSNPHLRQLRLDQQLILKSDVSAEITARTPLTDLAVKAIPEEKI